MESADSKAGSQKFTTVSNWSSRLHTLNVKTVCLDAVNWIKLKRNWRRVMVASLALTPSSYFVVF